MFLEIMCAVAVIMCVLLAAALIYLYVRVFSNERNLQTTVAEIKSKIGSIIRDINNINRIEYDVDMEQQAKINNISRKFLTSE